MKLHKAIRKMENGDIFRFFVENTEFGTYEYIMSSAGGLIEIRPAVLADKRINLPDQPENCYTIIPAPTVLLVNVSIRIKLPVNRFSAYES